MQISQPDLNRGNVKKSVFEIFFNSILSLQKEHENIKRTRFHQQQNNREKLLLPLNTSSRDLDRD